jgi:hypothetical protein
MRGLAWPAFIAGACLLVLPSSVQAEEVADQAKAHFDEGRNAMKRGDYVSACVKFAQSQDLDPSLGTLLNLSVCEERQGHLLRASALLERFLETAGPADGRRPSAEQLFHRIEARLSRLVVLTALSGAAEVRLNVDGEVQRFTAGDSLTLDPGRHELELSAVGYATERVTLVLAEGEVRHLSVALHALPPAPPSPRSLAPTPHVSLHVKQGKPPLFYIGLGASVAGVLTIAGSAVLIAHERSTVHDHCIDKACDQAGLAAGERGRTFVAVNTLAWPVALAGASLAAYFFLFPNNQTRQQQYAVGVTGNAGQPSLFFEGRFQ